MTKSENGKKKILIVEDNRHIANDLSCFLEKYGSVEIAGNGREALMKSPLDSFDAIISDVKMPLMDGIEFYHAAAESWSGIKKRILFLTSTFSQTHLNFFIDNNLPYLFKPAEIADIESSVEDILAGKCPDYSEIAD